MKFECLDPLNESFLELKVATCIEILKDGYLKIGFDGPDMEAEVFYKIFNFDIIPFAFLLLTYFVFL